MNKQPHAVVLAPSRELLEVLRTFDYRILLAENGIEGVRLIIRHQPDVVFLQVDTPHLSGFNIARLLQILAIHTPLVFLTQDAESGRRAERFPATIGWVSPQEISLKLPKLLETGIFPPDPAPDYLADFRQHEWGDLLSLSGKKKLLIVEDSTTMRKVELKALDATGEFALFSVPNGLEGIKKALLVRPDLIISDVEMPEINGLTMSQIFYILGKPFPIVFLTDRDDHHLMDKARRLPGVLGYFLKQDLRDPGELISKVKAHLGFAEMIREASARDYLGGAVETLAQTTGGQGVSGLE
ncbi:MAG: response regulator [Deltaproteobacteria bacterium]|nr:response regulator [Deltaproteobacteria bacterium]